MFIAQTYNSVSFLENDVSFLIKEGACQECLATMSELGVAPSVLARACKMYLLEKGFRYF